MTKFKTIYCVPCGKKSKCRLTTGREIYPDHINPDISATLTELEAFTHAALTELVQFAAMVEELKQCEEVK